MRIVSLSAENIKRLKVVEITPKGDVVQITGRNASGKSSVLDSIMYALGGEKSIPGEPVRKGCDKAKIKLNLGTVVVERRFTPSGTTISVTSADGATYKSPQKMLDDLLGALTFDPLQFSRQKPKEQFDTLRKLVNLPIDIDALNAANQNDYEHRTEINRQTKQFTVAANGIIVPEGTPAEPEDESAFLDGIEKAGTVNADIQRRQGNRTQAERKVADSRIEAETAINQITVVNERTAARVSDLQRQIEQVKSDSYKEIAELQDKANRVNAEADELASKLKSAPPLPTPVSISELRTKLDAAKIRNVAVADRKRREGLLEQAKQSESAAKSLTDAMEARDKQKEDAIKAAAMPVPGLGFGADHVTYNGIPFDQASSAEKLRVSAAIAMAGNPKLRVIRIQDGSLLDEDGLKIISDMATEKDYQVWLEAVDSTGKVGIYMEDGEVAAVNEAQS